MSPSRSFCASPASSSARRWGFFKCSLRDTATRDRCLFHRPLSPSRVFLAKAIAGMSLYVVALGIPFVCLEIWKARPGNLLAAIIGGRAFPGWRTFSGPGLLLRGDAHGPAGRAWYGSRGLALAAAFFCSFLVWVLPEFWQALLAIAIIGLLVSVAAWGSICAALPTPRNLVSPRPPWP